MFVLIFLAITTVYSDREGAWHVLVLPPYPNGAERVPKTDHLLLTYLALSGCGRTAWCAIYFVVILALGLALGTARVAAQQVRAGVLSCDVAGGLGLVPGSQKLVSCSFTPEGEGRREDYDGSITKYGVDLGLTRGSRMLWIVFTNTVAGPGFLAGDYFGATGEATVGAGLGTNVLLGGSNRTVTLQPISLSGQTGLNLAIGVAALQLGLPRQLR
jgi:hypothetical protein